MFARNLVQKRTGAVVKDARRRENDVLAFLSAMSKANPRLTPWFIGSLPTWRARTGALAPESLRGIFELPRPSSCSVTANRAIGKVNLVEYNRYIHQWSMD
jgi:hypothetical protein